MQIETRTYYNQKICQNSTLSDEEIINGRALYDQAVEVLTKQYGFASISPEIHMEMVFNKDYLQSKCPDKNYSKVEAKPNIIINNISMYGRKYIYHFEPFKEINFKYAETLYPLDSSFSVITPAAYLGHKVSDDHAHTLFALVVDIDSCIERKYLNNLLELTHKYELDPQLIVLSGRGLHYWYVLDEPLLIYHNNKLINILDRLVKRLSGLLQIAGLTVKKIDYCQRAIKSIRMPGVLSKLYNSTYNTGDYHTQSFITGASNTNLRILANKIDSLYCQSKNQTYKEIQKALKEKLELDLKEKGIKVRKFIWKDKKMYTLFLEAAKEYAVLGTRYWWEYYLAWDAYICNVEIDELKRDLKNLNEIFNKKFPDDEMTESDIKSALNNYSKLKKSHKFIAPKTEEMNKRLFVEGDSQFAKIDESIKIVKAKLFPKISKKRGRPVGAKTKKKSNKKRTKIFSYLRNHKGEDGADLCEKIHSLYGYAEKTIDKYYWEYQLVKKSGY